MMVVVSVLCRSRRFPCQSRAMVPDQSSRLQGWWLGLSWRRCGSLYTRRQRCCRLSSLIRLISRYDRHAVVAQWKRDDSESVPVTFVGIAMPWRPHTSISIYHSNNLVPSVRPMTHIPEIGTENRYRFLTRLACNSVPKFSATGFR